MTREERLRRQKADYATLSDECKELRTRIARIKVVIDRDGLSGDFQGGTGADVEDDPAYQREHASMKQRLREAT